jgi:uncharacterized OsmC-like protein
VNKVIAVKFAGGKKVDVVIGQTTVKTDQTVRSGGEGSAPEPFQHFLASIAACTAVYALEFCSAREIPMEGMEFRMICELDPKSRRYVKMILELTLPRGFPEKFREAIIRSMDLCSVKRHIVNPPDFEIKAVPFTPQPQTEEGNSTS